MKMKNLLSKVFIFTAGAAIGSAVTWKLVKTKYEKLALEEVEAVREYYSTRDEKKKEEGSSGGWNER